jgi:hypothetical protein
VNDDDISELILLANAYLDGELDAAAVARAEADPAVMAEVAALRELQDGIRDVEPAGDDVRGSAIAAALDEFDALQAAHVPVPPADPAPARVAPFRPRPSYARWLAVAAGVVGVGLLGAVVVNGTRGGDDEQSAQVAESDAAASGEETARTAAAEAFEAEETATAESAESAPTALAATEAPATVVTATGDATAAEESAADVADTTAPAVVAQVAPFDPERPITSPDELAVIGSQLLAAEAAGTGPRTVETRCDLSPFAPYERGLYDADGDGAAAPIDVVVAIDLATLQTGAFDADTCVLVAVSPLP